MRNQFHRQSRRRIAESFAISLVLLIVFLGTGALGQNRQADQGYGGTTTRQVWLVKICDSAGANCGVVAIPVTVTGTMTVTGTVTGSVSATSATINQIPAITQTSGTVNSATISQMPTLSVTSGTIGQITMPSLTVTSGTIGQITMPSLTFTSGTVGSMPSLTVTSGTIGQITMPSLTVTSGTVQANQGTAANGTLGWPSTLGNVTATSVALTSASALDTTIGLPVTNYGTIIVSNLVAGTVAAATLNFEVSDDGGSNYRAFIYCSRQDSAAFAGSNVSATASSLFSCGVTGLTNFRVRLNPAITNTGSATVRLQASAGASNPTVPVLNNVANNFAVNLLNYGSAAVSTANPFFDGGRASTDTRAAVADAAAVANRLDKVGNLIVQPEIQDFNVSAVGSLTATTASSIFGAAPGANYRFAIYAITACNLSGTIATVFKVTDSAVTIAQIPWTATALGGQPDCQTVPFPLPYLTAANSTVSVNLTVSDATGVSFAVSGTKTRT